MSHIQRGLVFAAAALLSLAAHAAPITYTFSGIASGTVGQTPFTDQPLTVVIQGDTANVVPILPGLPAILTGLTNTLSLGALLSDSITDGGLYVFNDQGTQIVGFGSNDHLDLITLGPDGLLASYDLASSFGPITSLSPGFGQFVGVALLGGGTLSLSGLTDASFTAVTEAAMPVPAPLALIPLGFAGIWFTRRRRPRHGE